MWKKLHVHIHLHKVLYWYWHPQKVVCWIFNISMYKMSLPRQWGRRIKPEYMSNMLIFFMLKIIIKKLISEIKLGSEYFMTFFLSLPLYSTFQNSTNLRCNKPEEEQDKLLSIYIKEWVKLWHISLKLITTDDTAKRNVLGLGIRILFYNIQWHVCPGLLQTSEKDTLTSTACISRISPQ